MKFPPQHGAWVFLVLPSLITAFLGGGTWLGFTFSLTWITAFPFTYFLGRALISRWRRGSWTTRGSRELTYALPWSVITILGAVVIVGSRPWIIFPGLIVLALWAISVYLSWAGRERGLANDLILVLLAAISPILMYQVAKDESSLGVIPKSIWITSMVSLLFFIGSVLHVKALIRESKDPRWHVSSILFHIIALLGLVMITGSWALAIPFALALVRTVFMKPGLRPGRIGIVEAVVAVALVIGTVVGQS